MSDSRLGRTPRSEPQWAREIQRRIDRLERPKTGRFGSWVGSERDGRPILTKPGAAPLEAGQPPAPEVIDLTASTSPFHTPPTQWTTLNLGAATVTLDRGTVLLSTPPAAGTDMRLAYKTLEFQTNYVVTAHIETAMAGAGDVRTGLVLRESGTGKFIVFGPMLSTGVYLAVSTFNSPTSFNAHYATMSVLNLVHGIPNWLRIRDDGTNRICEYSHNGDDWVGLHTVGRADFAAPDEIGVAVLNTNSGQPCHLRMRSFQEDIPGA